ncbi:MULTISPECIES: ankyrin repeat domain-containing protein [unclassified Xanthomonas]|uniref:ankyrin repeat domain-containing protein n=1 Tax=Xanthomonas TaxID=338 RepID=UPI003557A99E
MGRRSTRQARAGTRPCAKPSSTGTRAWWCHCWRPGLGRGSFNHNGQTPLHFAAQVRDTESCLRLIAAGVDPSLRDFQGKSPLELAVGKEKQGMER